MSISEFVRTAALSRIEDELDLAVWDEAKPEFDANPKTLSANEVAAKYLCAQELFKFHMCKRTHTAA